MNRWLTVNRKLLAVILIISLLSVGFMPIIASNNNNNPLEGDITIINVYSYPSVGSNWTVRFTTIGKADLLITAVNGTTWSNSSNSYDLRFLSIQSGNETLDYKWMNGSVFVESYSSDEIGYETCKVLTSGRHTLRFQFGDDVAYAFNDASNWWNTSWNYRKLVTINSSLVDSDLNNFPILVNITDGDLASKAQNDGDDIVFILYSDNNTQLNHKIELFNDTSGELVAWVNVTNLSSSVDTKIWMYYNNSGCSSQENITGVWDDNYIAVWHLNETSGTHYDSTSNNHNSSAVIGVTQDANGKVDGGDEFDGSSSYIDITMNLPSTVTITAWAKSTASSFADMLWCIDSDNQGPDLYYTGNQICLNTWDGAGNPFCNIPSDVDKWHLYTTVIQSGNTNLYIDDQLGGSANYRNPTGSDFHISSSAGYDWEGSIDEVRISNIARNSSWINTSYNTMNNTDKFISLGPEEQSSPVISNPVPNDEATDIDVPPNSFNITISDPNEDNMNITWRTNESGSWTTFNTTDGSGSGVGDGTYNATNTSWVDSYSTKYWWSVNVTDGTTWSNQTYSFTTRPQNYAPTISNVYPSNGSIAVDLQVTCSIQVNDLDGDAMNVYWYNSTDGIIFTYQQTNSSVDSGDTVYWTYTMANNYSITYYWKVAVNDTKDNTTSWYNFTTHSSDYTKPSSNVTAITPYWYGPGSNPLNITCTDAQDDPSGDGLKNVTLYYYNSTDNSTWSGPWNFDVDKDPWIQCNWSFTFPNGTGYYRFYSRATDNATNVEDPPTVNDTNCGYDNAKPTSTVDTISPYILTTSPFTINATASDSHTNVKNVTLWYRYSSDNFTYWNTYWSKRKPIYLNVSSGSTLSNHQVLFNITYENDMNNNFSDLRFVNYSNSSKELDYWIEDKNDGNWANVWVELDSSITTTNQTLAWMYYGNASAESKSNGTATFEFFDNFPGTSLDTITWSATGSYSVDDGITITTGSVYTDSTVSSSPQDLTFEIKASYSGPDASYSGLEIADAQSTSGSNSGSNALAYHMTDNSGQDISLWGADGTVASYNIVSGGSLSPNPTLGTYYILGFTFYGTSQISYFYRNLDYSEIDRATYSGTWNDPFYLWLGYFTGSAAGGTNIDDITVKWVRIRKYSSSEPTYYIGEEDWTEWNNASNPDTDGSDGWSWDFDFPDGLGWYDFYSIANDTVGNQENAPSFADTSCNYNPWTNTPPTIEAISPADGAADISLQPTCQIWANDTDGHNLTIYWYENTTGDWVLRNTNNNVTANSTVGYKFSEFNNYSITYYWKAAANDSLDNTSAIYHFTTTPINTSVDPITPYKLSSSPFNITATGGSDLDNVTLWYRYSSNNFSWWNNSWSNRKPIYLNVSSGETPENYTVLLNISYKMGMQSDFDDLRFIRYSDNSTELDYWIEDKSDGSWADVWVEIRDNITTSNQTLTWMYYGNSGVSSASNGTNTFSFFDDFDSFDSSTWSATGSYSVSSSQLTITTGAAYSDNTVASQPSLISEAKVKWNNFAGYSGLEIADAQSTQSSNGGSNKLVYLMTNGGGSASVTAWAADGVASSYNIVSGITQFTATAGTTCILGHAVNSTDVIFYKDRAMTNSYSGTWSDPFYLWLGYFTGSASGTQDISDIVVDWVLVRKYSSSEPTYHFGSETFIKWNNATNPDSDSSDGWSWNFTFPNGTGYYEFYSIGNKTGSPNETAPENADAICKYVGPIAPVINSYNLTNSTGSKLNNNTGLLEVNNEYKFTINITDENGWEDIEYINITSWYDNGNDSSIYNQTQGGNLNMFLQYKNTTGTANFSMLWPDDEATLITNNCTETIINSTTRIINISFKPGSQTRWASSNNTWDTTQNITNDLWSWNFNITVTDSTNRKDYKRDEYGVYKYTSLVADSDWVDVYALPGFSDDSSIVTITYSSNYHYNLSIYFEENLTHTTQPTYHIPIKNNITIKADTDPDDDITSDKNFTGILETYAIDIINNSGTFQPNGTSQTIDVQFKVYVPFGTMGGKYTARVATKISQD